MAALIPRDYVQLLQVVHELNSPGTLADFPHRVMQLVSRLVSSERAIYSEVNLLLGRFTTLSQPSDPGAEKTEARLQPHLNAHPVVNYIEQTNERAPRATSDFWSRGHDYRSAISNECDCWLDVEDQLVLPFGPERQIVLSVTLNRSRRRFSERDRAVLELLRPHLTQAYLSAARASFLQDEIAERSGAPLCIARGQSSLLVRFSSNPPDSTSLSLEGHTAPAPSGGFSDALALLQALGVTRRQSEVLWWLSQGESNAQIAARLDLSQHTTKRHLEAIFTRLGVQNRAAAAHRAQQALRVA